jgi:hypothetical protein
VAKTPYGLILLGPLPGDREIRNSNLEIITPRRDKCSKQECSKRENHGFVPGPWFVLDFAHWHFDIVSDFGF